MIIKKFQANTETEAIMLAREELGKDAVVMNIKTISPKGFYKLFRKKTVEVTAAADETVPVPERSKRDIHLDNLRASKDIIISDDTVASVNDNGITSDITDVKTSAIEEKLNNLASILEKQMTIRVTDKENIAQKSEDTNDNSHNLECIRLIYNQLINNEVEEKYANQIIGEVEGTIKKDSPMDHILASVYQKIVLKLGRTQLIDVKEKRPRIIFFIGPTGVGKTTTIAKLASRLKINNKIKVALLTADTYRIAAVEQLHTYAGILDVPLRVVYSDKELQEARSEMTDYDIILVDTAGRSHKVREQRDDIERLISAVPEEEREIYLVLSATTKYRDLVKITESYSEIMNYRLIFTKLDETDTIGNILNIRLLTDAPLSYATFGQNVPDDIGKVDAQRIAKQLLGGQ